MERITRESRANARRGFTIVHFLVVAAIVALSIGLLVPTIQRAREKSNLMLCRDNLRKIGSELILYARTGDGALPVSPILENPHAELLSSLTTGGLARDPKIFYCPSERRPELSYSDRNYRSGIIGYFYYSAAGAGDNADLSKFIRSEVSWPRNLTTSMDPKTWVMSDIWISAVPTAHAGYRKGVNYLRLDGSVDFISESPRHAFHQEAGFMAVFLIGIDDTDNDTSPGTGRLARRLAEELALRGARSLEITRHQFLVDARIPYTSHNSGACIAVKWTGPGNEMNVAMDLIEEWAAAGSDPGVCIMEADKVTRAMIDWGWRATREVLTMEEATQIAAANGAQLRALGGTGQGIIGALGSVGLRSDGNEGRFLDLPGLRDLGEFVNAEQLAGMEILVEHHLPESLSSRKIDRGAVYKTSGWVRPRLIKGKAVWPVEWSEDQNEWIGIDRKKRRPPE